MESPAIETGPLTAVVTWRVRKGCEREFEAWRHEIAAAALEFPGHMGVNVILPSGTERQYVVIFRFDTYEHLRAWQDSDIRRELLKKAEPFRENAPSYRLESGLEYWFAPPGHSRNSSPCSPSRGLKLRGRCFQVCVFALCFSFGYSAFSDAMSIEKRYFTSDLTIRSQASLIF